MIEFAINSDVQMVSLVVPPDSKETQSLAESRFDAFQKMNLPDLGLQSHNIEVLKVEKAHVWLKKLFEAFFEWNFLSNV